MIEIAVIDTSTIAKYLFREKNWDKVEERIEKENKIISLDLAIIELYNILWKKVYLLRGKVDLEKLVASIDLFTSVVEIKESGSYVKEALNISVKEGLSLYDSLFIALAKAMNDELLSSDKRQSDVGVKYIKVTYIE
ncbi:toxin VapC [Sulfolobales archaeon HS-7]|nr:toxin VapC [Sulfolobales archaeon HS-7]